MTSPDRLIAAGGVFAGLGGTLAITHYLGSPVMGPGWLGILGLVSVAVGIGAVLVGLFRRADPLPRTGQKQRSGARSTNVQAGRDITIDKKSH